MAGAVQNPFSAGKFPMTDEQRHTLTAVVSELCHSYSIPVTSGTTLTHAEVQKTLGIAQSGKIDIMWLPGMSKMGDAIVLGDQLRSEIQSRLD